MAPKEDSSLPTHIGQTIVNGMMDLKEAVGKLDGKVDGVCTAVGELRGQVSNAVNRDECASLMAGKRTPRPTGENGWKQAHTRIGVILGLCAVLAIFGTSALWLSSAFSTLEKAQVALQRLDGGK